MADSDAKPLALHSDNWMDTPQAAIDALLAAEGDIVIDASQTGAIPGQVAQLLIAAQRTALADQRGFRVQNPSAAAADSLTALGLSDLVAQVRT